MKTVQMLHALGVSTSLLLATGSSAATSKIEPSGCSFTVHRMHKGQIQVSDHWSQGFDPDKRLGYGLPMPGDGAGNYKGEADLDKTTGSKLQVELNIFSQQVAVHVRVVESSGSTTKVVLSGTSAAQTYMGDGNFLINRVSLVNPIVETIRESEKISNPMDSASFPKDVTIVAAVDVSCRVDSKQ